MIERGQTEAIQLVQSMVNTTTTTTAGESITNTMNTSRVSPMVFVDDEGLEEQILTEDEASQEVTDIQQTE